jgi:DNA-binding MarR family transcriptional regulator
MDQKIAGMYSRAELFFKFIIQTYDRLNLPYEYAPGQKLNMVESHTLMLICDVPGITVTETARYWRRTVGTISLRLSKLERLGLVTRRKESGNDKEVHLYATEAGAHMAAIHREQDNKRSEQALSKILEKCTPEEVGTYYKVVGALYESYTDE